MYLIFLGTGLHAGLQMLSDCFKKFNFTSQAFPLEMESRGFSEVVPGSEDILPGYYYRDDGYKIWKAVKNYVKNVLKEEYKWTHAHSAEKLMKNDIQLQNFLRELRDPDMANIKGVPNIEQPEQLVDLLSNIIFTCS